MAHGYSVTIPSRLTPLTAYRWFIEYGGRYNTKWENNVTHVEPDVSRHAYQKAPHPKKLVEVDGDHFGILHYPSVLFDMASQAQVDFLSEYLK
jgi:hypothetical protein